MKNSLLHGRGADDGAAASVRRGVFIGVFSNLFIYTTNEEFLGVVRYTESLAFLIWPLILMGASSSLINFTPKLKQKSNVKLFSY